MPLPTPNRGARRARLRWLLASAVGAFVASPRPAAAQAPLALAACGDTAALTPTDTATRLVHLSLGDPLPKAGSASRAWAENALGAIAAHLRPPATLTVPELDRYPFYVEPGRVDEGGPGLDGSVVTTMGRDGRIGLVARTAASGAAELDVALLDAVAAADSVGDLPPLPPGRGVSGILRVRVHTGTRTDRVSIPVLRVRLPFARAAVPPVPADKRAGPAPRYPTRARDAGVTGVALAQFVVDSTGRARMPTLRFLELTDEQFGDAVRAVLPQWKFEPARVNGCARPQLVQLPFHFNLLGPSLVVPPGREPFPPPELDLRWPPRFP